MTQWIEFATADDVAAAAADTITEAAAYAIKQRGTFKIVLAGGTTPLACYQILANRDLDWKHWQVFYGDERCLPENDDERNHQMVATSGLTDKIEQHYIIPAEFGPVKGAELYQSVINNKYPFDMVILGMGEDGHTASLFPELEWQSKTSDARVIAVECAPKPPPKRISLSSFALQDCRQMMLMITGQGKRHAVQQWLHGEMLPVSKVAAINQATVYLQSGLMD